MEELEVVEVGVGGDRGEEGRSVRGGRYLLDWVCWGRRWSLEKNEGGGRRDVCGRVKGIKG